MAGKQALLRTALAVCVPVAGYVIGRNIPPSPAKQEAGAAVTKTATAAPRKDDLSSLLCEISSGNLARARARINELRDSPRKSEDLRELEKLLTAIAMRDGATFDAIIATFPEDLRQGLTESCILALTAEPAAFVRLLADSEQFSRTAMAAQSVAAIQVIKTDRALFLDLLEQGEFAWPAETIESVANSLEPDPASALRLLDLCRSGQLKIANDFTLARIVEQLDEDGLAKMRAATSTGAGFIGSLLEREAKARELFANFDPSGKSWSDISRNRMIDGMRRLIADSGVPTIEWNGVSEDLQDLLPGIMAQTAAARQGDADTRILLDSIKNSELPESRRNEMLASAASVLFQQQGNIRLAIDFAHAISNDADGHNAGEDLLIKWMAFDPVSARDFTTKIEPSPYRDRILARVREISP